MPIPFSLSDRPLSRASPLPHSTVYILTELGRMWETLLSAGEADGVFQVCLDAAELAAYRTRFPANLDADTFQFV